MTLRDLSKRQLYNLRRRSEKKRKEWIKKRKAFNETIFLEHCESWSRGFNAGLKAGLEFSDVIST